MITRETKIILYDMETETYKTGTMRSRGLGEMPVCTQKHFLQAVCKFFEDVYPTMEKNPLYQDVDWSEVENRTEAA